MKFPQALEEVQFLRRYKRFFADVELSSGEVLTVHVPNTGSLKGLIEKPCAAMISRNDSPSRKLKGTLEMLRAESSWVGVNTQTPNILLREALTEQSLPHLRSWAHFQPEVPLHEKTRVDFVLHQGAGKLSSSHFAGPHAESYHLIEVKNVTLAEGSGALFPDAPSVRALKHIHDLMEQKKKGASVEMLYVIQREDVDSFGPAHEIDPSYAGALQKAFKEGLQITALMCELTASEIRLKPEPLKLKW